MDISQELMENAARSGTGTGTGKEAYIGIEGRLRNTNFPWNG